MFCFFFWYRVLIASCLSHRVGSCCGGLSALTVFCGDERHLYGTI